MVDLSLAMTYNNIKSKFSKASIRPLVVARVEDGQSFWLKVAASLHHLAHPVGSPVRLVAQDCHPCHPEACRIFGLLGLERWKAGQVWRSSLPMVVQCEGP